MIAAIMRRAVQLYGTEIGLEENGRSFTYQELAEEAAIWATIVDQRGVRPGERVAVLAPNGRLFYLAYFAAAHAGAVLVPLNTRAHAEGLARVLAHAGCKVLLYDPTLAPLAEDVAERARHQALDLEALCMEGELAEAAFRAAAPAPISARDRRPDDAAQLYYTSGTTGEPKGVILTHRNVCTHALMAQAALEITDRDTFGHIAPMFHLADAWATFAVTWVGGRHRMVPQFDAPVVAEELSSGVTVTNLVPTMLADLVHHPACQRDYPSMRLILSGGAPIAPALVERVIQTFGCEYVQTYGLTETSPFLTMSILPERLRRLSAKERLAWMAKTGRPLAGVELQVWDANHSPVAQDGQEVGEIVVRGDSVTVGYFRNHEATAAAFHRGWFRTGDLATYDEYGFVNIVDRRKDVILTGGETVYSTEVEVVLYEHPQVQVAAVFGIPHPRWGEAVAAAVVPPAGELPGEEELQAYCRSRLGRHQVPKRIFVRRELPRTGSGKLQKRKLREEYIKTFKTPTDP